MSKQLSKQSSAVDSRPAVPSEFPDITTWAAWLYYVDEMTQSEVAKAVGVSRVTVIKILNDAKAAGIVSVRISPKVASRVATSKELVAAYGLDSATIIPANPDIPLIERLGKAGAFALIEDIEPDDVIGVAWGRTVLAVAQNLRLDLTIENVTVVSVSASPNGLSADFSPELCAALCANNLGARSVNLLAPAIVSSPELRAMLLNEPSIRNQLDVIKSANKVVFGVGELSKGATLRSSELHNDQTIEKLVKQGAVGAILGTFIGVNGEEMSGPTHDRAMGISLSELKTIPSRLCVAGGPEKVAAIRGALIGGFATSLITDYATAKELIAQAH